MTHQITRDSFIFYRSFFETIEDLEDKQQLEIYRAIAQYSLNDEPANLSGISRTIFRLIEPQLLANKIRFINGKLGAEHGKKGGRPKTPKEPQENPTLTPNKNVNVNVNKNNNLNCNENLKSQFESFWNLYDKKEGRKDCEKKFQLALKKESFEKIMAGLQRYVKARGSDKKYWKLPETWLNKESWNDEYAETTTKPTNFVEELNSIAGEQLFKVIDTHYDKALLRCITIDHKEQALKLDSEIRKKIKEKIAEKYPNKTLEVTY